MTFLDQSLLAIILLLLLALAVAMVAWLRAAVRADAAEDLAIEAHTELRCVRRELKAANADVRRYRRRLTRYENPDQPITTVDQFLNDLFPGGQR